MTEIWKEIAGYEGRYEVSNAGRVRSVAFAQRYLLRNGAEAFRMTTPRILAQQAQNCGYLLVHLHLNNKRKAFTVHRLVAAAFCGAAGGEVNHKNGNKRDNRAENLEWVSRTANHNHAVDLGLNVQAIRVVCPKSGTEYPSISRAAREARHSHRKVRATFGRAV